MFRHIICSLVLLLFVISLSVAQDRGMINTSKEALLLEDPYRTSWALLIGINKYPDLPTQYQLNYAVNDVNGMKKILLEQYQFPADNIITLTDKQATKQKINDAMGQLADRNKVKLDDRVLVYFSGHGQTVTLQNGSEMGYLLPYDAKVDIDDVSNPSSYYTTCIGMDELRRLSQLIPAKHVLFLVDACYSGLAINNSRSGLQPSVANYLQKISSLKSRQIITAGLKDEESIEKPEWGHGAFTYKLLEALQTGVADENSDDVITGLELASYLRNVVPNISPNQTPQYGYFEGEGEFLFLKQQNSKVEEPIVIEELSTISTLLVNSDPTDCIVYMDEKQLGKTPYTLTVDTGIEGKREITIAVTKDGYETKKAKIQVTAGKTSKWVAKLDKIKPVILTESNNDQMNQSNKYKKAIYGWLGIKVRDLNQLDHRVGIMELKGIYVEDVLRGSPAEKSGLCWRDIIFELDGNQILGEASFNELVRKMPGKNVKIKIIRGTTDAIEELDVEIGEWTEFLGKDGSPMVLVSTPDGKSFCIEVNPVTNEKYKKFIESTGRVVPKYWGNIPASNEPWVKKYEPKKPVVGVSWDDAQAYCQWVGKRLPTASEWTKASNNAMLNFFYDYGSFYDWCVDWYKEGYRYDLNSNGPEIGEQRVIIRLASIGQIIEKRPPYLIFDNVGFRCAMDVPQASELYNSRGLTIDKANSKDQDYSQEVTDTTNIKIGNFEKDNYTKNDSKFLEYLGKFFLYAGIIVFSIIYEIYKKPNS